MGTTTDMGLLALRLGIGGTIAAHGAQKLLGWFGGGGLDGTSAMFESMGLRPGRQNAMLAGITEVGGGALLAAGLATPAAGATVAGTMIVASSVHTPHGFFAIKGGYEYSAMLALTGLSLALTGPGACSLDSATGHALDRPWMRVLAAATVAPAAALVIAKRKAALTAPPADTAPSAAAEPAEG